MQNLPLIYAHVQAAFVVLFTYGVIRFLASAIRHRSNR